MHMAKKGDIRRRDGSELHRQHLITAGHPGRRGNVVPERDDILHGLNIHQMRGAFDLNDGLTSTDGVVTVLEVKAEGEMGAMLKEDITDRAVNNIVDGRGLHKHPRGQYRRRGEHGILSTDLVRYIRLLKGGKLVVTDAVDNGGHN